MISKERRLTTEDTESTETITENKRIYPQIAQMTQIPMHLICEHLRNLRINLFSDFLCVLGALCG